MFAYSPYRRSDWRKYWLQENKGAGLAKRLDEIVGELERAAPLIAELEAKAKRDADERHRQYEEAERKRRHEAVIAAKEKAVSSSREELLAVIETWATARHIQHFLSELAEDVASSAPETRNELQSRLDVARGLIRRHGRAGVVRRGQNAGRVVQGAVAVDVTHAPYTGTASSPRRRPPQWRSAARRRA